MRKKVIEIYQSGKGYKAISKALGLPRTTVRAIIYKWRKHGTVENLPRSGRPTKITPRVQRQLIQEVTKDPTTTSKELQASLASVKGVFLPHSQCSQDNFQIHHNPDSEIDVDVLGTVIRKVYRKANFTSWGDLGTFTMRKAWTMRTKGEVKLHLLNPTEQLGENKQVFGKKMESVSVLPGNHRSVLKGGGEEGDVPEEALYQDLNPVQHLWDVLDKQVRSMEAPPPNLPDLKDLLLTSWYQIPQHTFRDLVEPMPRRLFCINSPP
ncbi:hypothetical protein QTP86_012998 [Hemibagrus guttatus]|nr:hypothetical protein QTP86_012998 [Hemibagrus guttatus]